MMRNYFLSFLLLMSLYNQAQVMLKKEHILMGCQFEFTVVDDTQDHAEEKIAMAVAEVQRIENLISEWQNHTQVSKVNQMAGVAPVKVDAEVFNITKKALYFSEISNGAFDISIVAMDKIWRFDGSMTKMPSPEILKQSVAKVGYQHIILDSLAQTIFLAKKGMKIGFGSIGKGYAADKCREILQAHGVKAGLINASGDLACWGKQPNGQAWHVGLQDPFKSGEMLAKLQFNNGTVATSGDYQKFVEFNGQRYAHIINPKTGYPSTELTSVTVVGPSTEMANGFSTSIMVLGKKGLYLLKNRPEYSALLVTNKGRIIKTKNFRSKIDFAKAN